MGIGLVIGIAVGIIALLLLALVGIYNGLVQLRNQVDNGWSQIDVQLKRRHDLIPNLVETAKGYMKHEQETFKAITEARASALGCQQRQGRRRCRRCLRAGLEPVPLDRGELSRPQGQPELPGPARGTFQHGKQDLLQSPELQ